MLLFGRIPSAKFFSTYRFGRGGGKVGDWVFLSVYHKYFLVETITGTIMVTVL